MLIFIQTNIKMPRDMYFFHFKNYNDSGQISRAVTGAYTIDPVKGRVKLAGTIYKKQSKDDHWNRRLHCQRARERLVSGSPFILDLGGPIDIYSWDHQTYRYLEDILHNFMCQHGAHQISEDKCSRHATGESDELLDRRSSESDDSYDYEFDDESGESDDDDSELIIHDISHFRKQFIRSWLMTKMLTFMLLSVASWGFTELLVFVFSFVYQKMIIMQNGNQSFPADVYPDDMLSNIYYYCVTDGPCIPVLLN